MKQDSESNQIIEEDSVFYSEKLETFEKSGRNASLFTSIFNLANGLVGSGILSFPFCIYCCGIVTGAIISVIVIVLSLTGAEILMLCSRKEEIIQILYSSGLLITYLIVIGQFIHPVIWYFAQNSTTSFTSFISDEKLIISFFAVVVIFPITLLREVKKLGLSSVIAMSGLGYFSVFILVTTITKINNNETDPALKNLIVFQREFYAGSYYPKIFLALPILCFGYQANSMIFPVLYELKKPKLYRSNLTIFGALALVSIAYIINGFFGVIAFGTSVDDNILNNFSGNDIFANIARLFIGISIIFSYPVQNYTVRLAIISLIWGRDKNLSTFWFLVVQTVYFFICLILSLVIPTISVGFSFIGAVGATTLMFLFPGLLAAKVLTKEYPKWKVLFYVIFVLFMLLFGFVGVTGLVAAVFRLIDALNQ